MTLQECFETAGKTFPFKVQWISYKEPFYITGFYNNTPGAGFEHKNNGPYNGGCFNTDPLDEFTFISAQKLYNLSDLRDLGNTHLFKVRKVIGLNNFGMQKPHQLNDILTITEWKSGNVYFLEGGYVGIKSTVALETAWELVNQNTTEATVKTPDPILLTEEQEKVLKEKAIEMQALIVENTIRLALFTKTMEKVKQEDVETVVDVVYSKKAETQFTKKQLEKAINKAVIGIYGENLGQ